MYVYESIKSGFNISNYTYAYFNKAYFMSLLYSMESVLNKINVNIKEKVTLVFIYCAAAPDTGDIIEGMIETFSDHLSKKLIVISYYCTSVLCVCIDV